MPLEPEVLKGIREDLATAEARLIELHGIIEEAHRAGIDVTEERKDEAKLREQIRKLKSVYG